MCIRGKTGHPLTAVGHSRRHCRVRLLVRYPRHRTLPRPRVACLSSSCVRSASSGHCRRNSLDPGLGRSGEHDAHGGRRRAGIPTAVSPPANYCPGASLGFCGIATWRRTAQDCRGSNRRPSDGSKRPAAAHASRLDSFCGFPIPRQQSIESIDRMPVDHALEHVMQVGVGFDVVQFGSFNQRAERRPARSAIIGAELIMPGF